MNRITGWSVRARSAGEQARIWREWDLPEGKRQAFQNVVKTDEARRHGVEVPFTRPAELATDTAKSGPVIAHAMDWIEREGREKYDAVIVDGEPLSQFLALPPALDAASTAMAFGDPVAQRFVP